MGLKARGIKRNNSGKPKIDYEAIAAQVDEGSHGARISQIIDLGMHQDSTKLSNKGYTAFETEEEAEQFIEDMIAKYGERHSAFENEVEVEDADEANFDDKKTKLVKLKGKGDKAEWVEAKGEKNFVVKINEYGGYDKKGEPLEYQELAIMADLTELEVDYGGDIGIKPYRVLLNKFFKGNINGFQLKKSPPEKDGGVWTVKSNTKLAEIATATGLKSLLQVDLEEADWAELLGQAMNVSLTKSGDKEQYVNVGKCVALKKKKNRKTGEMEVEEVEELAEEPLLITFDDVTVDILKKAHLRYDIIQKIKSASDYKGSQMQEALEEYEEWLEAQNKSKPKSEDDDVDQDTDDDDNDDDEDEVVEKRKVTKVTKKAPAKSKGKKAVEPEPDEDEDEPVDDEDDETWTD